MSASATVKGSVTARHPNLAMLRQFAEATNQVFWCLQIDPKQVAYVSPAFQTIWGIPAERLYQNPRTWVLSIHPEDRSRVTAASEDWVQGVTATYSAEYRLLQPNGSVRWIRDQGLEASEDLRSSGYMCGISEDITPIRNTQTTLDQALSETKRLKKRLQLAGLSSENSAAQTVSHDGIIGDSPGISDALNRIDKVAGTDATVLVLGETGTGKGLFARAIHRRSQRYHQPFVKVNCASLPKSLIESELFGHVKGAFTGATTDRKGRFELANGGTIFLDEIGELDPNMQSKLLHVLQEGEFERLGTSKSIRVDVRVVAATNRDLYAEVMSGKFRADLYYRLAVFPIVLPPLRQRAGDIPALVWNMISDRSSGTDDVVPAVPEHVMQKLLQHDWPGNVRELQNVVERSLIMSEGTTLTVADTFDGPVVSGEPENTPSIVVPDQPKISTESLHEVDRAHITNVLEACNWVIKGRGRAAERLGLSPSTLRYRMKKLGIVRPDIRKPR